MPNNKQYKHDIKQKQQECTLLTQTRHETNKHTSTATTKMRTYDNALMNELNAFILNEIKSD